jgi:hypothetical protein
MVEVILVFLTAPEVHVCDLEVRPEMAGRVAICLVKVIRSAFRICQPFYGVVLVKILWMSGDKFHGFGPEGWEGIWAVVDVDDETVGLVVVFHVAEDIIVDVAEEAGAELR